MLLLEIRHLSHRVSMRTKNIRQNWPEETEGKPHIEFEFSSRVTMAKFIVSFEIGVDYPFEKMPCLISPIFGEFSREKIEETIRKCEPGYGLLERICVELNLLVSAGQKRL